MVMAFLITNRVFSFPFLLGLFTSPLSDSEVVETVNIMLKNSSYFMGVFPVLFHYFLVNTWVEPLSKTKAMQNIRSRTFVANLQN